ncbi:carboxy-terminal processing protease CtpA [Abditibacteriota bacterium]|nr:carboxy-terminal processing protease CtpA [Abditibacteriota bacterium]
MNLKSRAAYAVFVLGAMGTAFGAGYGAHANRFPSQWRWPADASPTAPLTRTADGNVMVAAATADSKTPRVYKPDLRPYETLDEVRRAIKENFVSTKVDDVQITNGAIRGMLRSLGDRFTRYLPPDDYTEFLSSNKGEFTGIGARIDVQDDYAGSAQAKPFGASRPYIVEPIPGGPAEKAGLKRGDVILAVNGKSTADMSEDATVSFIRGTQGTPVSLKIERKLNNAKALRDIKYNTFDIQLTRDTIELNPVTLNWLPGNIAWMKLDEFNEKTDVEIGNALKQIKAGQDGASARGIIFDMRGNPGGLLTAAVDVGSRFISKGPIVFQRERNGEVRPLNAEPDKFMNLKVPIVVLVDGYSASAAEIVTGALKDDSAATVVGAQTFGKASVQVLVDLKNGGALVITTAKYLTPAKNDISDKGIMPDVVVAASPEDGASGRGAQLQKAVDVIKSKLAVPGTMTARAN